jgi:hypothetical protein
MKRSIAYISAFIMIWAVWFFLCPNYLRMLEGFDFFTTLPDFWNLNLEIPKPVFMYVSAFLLQFYAIPAVAAAIQALLTLLQVLCVDTVVRIFFKDSDRLHWIPFIATPFFTVLLCRELSLTGVLICLAASACAAIVMRLATLKMKPLIQVPAFMRNCWVGAAVIVLAVSASVFVIYKKHVNTGVEKMSYLDHLVEEKEWEKILDTVTPNDAVRNTYMRRCALLAMIQTGQLGDKAFMYGLSGLNDYFYDKPEIPILRNFNMKFYSNIGMYCPAIYYSYQQATLFLLSMSFNSARSLADIYLQVKDYDLAKKYLEILSNTTCHSKWVKDRLPELEAIRNATPVYAANQNKNVFGSFKYDLPVMMDRYPEDSRYVHMYLCGLLADKQGGLFYERFCDTLASEYAEGKKMPKAYQEAVLMALSSKPEELKKHNIDPEMKEKFMDFVQLVSTGRDAVAKRKYAGSYWAYLYFSR